MFFLATHQVSALAPLANDLFRNERSSCFQTAQPTTPDFELASSSIKAEGPAHFLTDAKPPVVNAKEKQA